MKTKMLWQAVVCAVAGCVLLAAGCAVQSGSRRPVTKLTSQDILERECAHAAIMQSGAGAVPALEKQAASPGRVDLRQASVIELGKLARQNSSAEKPAVDALVRLFMKQDEIVSSVAAAVLTDVGKPAIAPLAAVTVMPVAAPGQTVPQSAWRLPVTLMMTIDPKAAVRALVIMLGDPAYAAQQAAIVAILGDITDQRFQYNPQGSAEERQATVRKWQEWWKAQGETKP